MLPKDRISDQKSIGLRLRIVVLLQASKPGYRGGVGRITVPSMNCLQSPVWRLSMCLESGIIFNIHFIMQNPSKKLLKLKLGNSKVLQITS